MIHNHRQQRIKPVQGFIDDAATLYTVFLKTLNLKNMTCIVGFIDKKNKKVIIGADSAGVAGLELKIRKDPKVFKLNDFVIGCTSSFRMIQLLNFSLELPEVEEDIYKYMCTKFINAVRECFKKGGFLSKSNEQEEGGVFLVGYKSRLFCIQIDFQVEELYSKFNAVGCGDEYAKGALSILSEDKNIKPKAKVLKALEVASIHSAGVEKPFVLRCT